MLTPRLPPPFLTRDILSIPDMMQHSPTLPARTMDSKNKKKSLIPTWFFCWERRNLHAAWRRMKRLMCCSFLCQVIDSVLSQNGSNSHLVSFKALCCGESSAVFIPEWKTFSVYSIFCPQTLESGLRSVLRLRSSLFVWHPAQTCLTSSYCPGTIRWSVIALPARLFLYRKCSLTNRRSFK